MSKFYITFLSIIAASSLHSMEISSLIIPTEIRQNILLQQFNYIPATQDLFNNTCKDIIIFKRINTICYNHINDPVVILSFIHKLYKQFPNEAHLDNFSHLLRSPGITQYCNKSRQINPLRSRTLNTKTITELVEEGADVNCRTKYPNREIIGTPLMYCVCDPYYPNGNDPNNGPQLECIQTLLDLGADYNVKCNKQSALTSAIYAHKNVSNNIFAIRLLLNYNLNHTVLSNALCGAISSDAQDIIELVIQKIQKSSDCIAKDLASGLCTAVQLNKQKIMHTLLLLGANPEKALKLLTAHILSRHIKQEPIDQLYETFTLLCSYLSNNNNNSEAIESTTQLNTIISVATKLLTAINNREK